LALNKELIRCADELSDGIVSCD